MKKTYENKIIFRILSSKPMPNGFDIDLVLIQSRILIRIRKWKFSDPDFFYKSFTVPGYGRRRYLKCQQPGSFLWDIDQFKYQVY